MFLALKASSKGGMKWRLIIILVINMWFIKHIFMFFVKTESMKINDRQMQLQPCLGIMLS